MVIDIIQGEAQPFNVTLRNKVTGDPIDLTGYQTITASVKVGSTTVTKTAAGGTITVSNAAHGKFTFTLTTTDTDSLSAVSSGTLEVSYQLSGTLYKVQIPNAYSVTTKIV